MASEDAVVAQGLECSLCLELLREPKLLSCTHTFCQQCLERLYRSQVELHGNNLVCPLCREKTFVTDGDVSKLKTNIPIKGLVDDVKTAGKACSMCAPEALVPAKKYCLEGCEYMCEACLQIHIRFKKTSAHELVDIEEIISGKVKVKQFCLKHPKEELEWFCLKCKVPICLRCRIHNHADKEHKIEELSEYKKQFREKIKATLQKANSAVNEIKDSIKAMNQEKTKVEAHFDGRIKDIEQAYKDARREIDKKRSQLIAECNRLRHNMTTEIDSMENIITKKMSGIESASQLVENGGKGLLGGNALAVHDRLCNEFQELIAKLGLSEVKPKDVTSKAEDVKFIKETGVHELGKIVSAGRPKGYTLGLGAGTEYSILLNSLRENRGTDYSVPEVPMPE